MDQEKPTVKEYSNGEITVVWQPDKCIHSTRCYTGLPEVFDPKARPWVDMSGADSAKIMEQVKKCPSGALSYFANDNTDGKKESADGSKSKADAERVVEVVPNGPLMISGDLEVKHSDGSITQEHRTTAFCRCGGSGNKPYCDGSHKKNGFQG